MNQKFINKSDFKEHFTHIPNATVRDNSISFGARGVLAMALSNIEDWQIRQYDLIRNNPEGKERIRSIFRELEQAGYIRGEKVMTKERGGVPVMQWFIYDRPVPEQERTNMTKWKN